MQRMPANARIVSFQEMITNKPENTATEQIDVEAVGA